jgi:dihydropteroate synthase
MNKAFNPGDINIRGKLFSFEKPIVMGIVNITPDSFYEESRHQTVAGIVAKTEQMIEDGASIIDVGAYSSRPGAVHISENEEIQRLEKAVEAIRNRFPQCIISIDTFRSEVARIMVENFSADIINDISGGTLDNNMFATIGRLKVPYILMHMKGTPQNMQSNTNYERDIVDEINIYFSKKIRELTEHGVNDIILDPGFGFAKNADQNFTILNRLHEMQIHNLPILAGLSRKSMIYKTLNTTPANSLNGTTALNTIALERGANILRVHDVKEAVEIIKLVEYMKIARQ